MTIELNHTILPAHDPKAGAVRGDAPLQNCTCPLESEALQNSNK